MNKNNNITERFGNSDFSTAMSERAEPILTPEKAGQVAQAPVSNSSVLTYDVSGSTPVIGGKLYDGGEFRIGAATLTAPRVVLKHVMDAAAPTNFNEYIAQLQGNPSDNLFSKVSYEDMQDEQFWTNLFSSVVAIGVGVAEDIQYMDGNLYDLTANIEATSTDAANPGYYSSTTDAVVDTMVNATVDDYSPKTRRIAKLAKALKLSVLAQTNDTNPLYFMSLSEIYDRLTDYFLFINRAISKFHNYNAAIDFGKLLQIGSIDAYNKYIQYYTADNIYVINQKLGKLKASLIGNYYDAISLSDYLECAVAGLAPSQKGASRIIIPTMLPDVNGAMSAFDPLIDTNNEYPVEEWIENVKSDIEDTINRLYSQDTAVIQTALAAFNGVPMLGDITWPGLSVKNRLAYLMMSHGYKAYGALNKLCNIVHSTDNMSNEGHQLLVMYPDLGSSYYANDQRLGTAPCQGAIVNFNGYGTRCYSGGCVSIVYNDVSGDEHEASMTGLILNDDPVMYDDPAAAYRLSALGANTVCSIEDTRHYYDDSDFKALTSLFTSDNMQLAEDKKWGWSALKYVADNEIIDHRKNKNIYTTVYASVGDSQVPRRLYAILHNGDIAVTAVNGNDAEYVRMDNEQFLNQCSHGASSIAACVALHKYGNVNNNTGLELPQVEMNLNRVSNVHYAVMPISRSSTRAYDAFYMCGNLIKDSTTGRFITYMLTGNKITVSGEVRSIVDYAIETAQRDVLGTPVLDGKGYKLYTGTFAGPDFGSEDADLGITRDAAALAANTNIPVMNLFGPQLHVDFAKALYKMTTTKVE